MTRNALIIIGFIIAGITGCSSEPEPLEISGVTEIEATVVEVNVEDRTVVLRGPQGNDLRLNVSPEVRNLAQVETGDKLRVSYYTGYLFSVAEPGAAGSDAEIAAERAAEGQRPAAAAGATMRATVEILSVARDGTSVSFRDAEGRLQSIQVHREDVQDFARQLDKGDLVDIRYSETVAVSVTPAE